MNPGSTSSAPYTECEDVSCIIHLSMGNILGTQYHLWFPWSSLSEQNREVQLPGRAFKFWGDPHPELLKVDQLSNWPVSGSVSL